MCSFVHRVSTDDFLLHQLFSEVGGHSMEFQVSQYGVSLSVLFSPLVYSDDSLTS